MGSGSRTQGLSTAKRAAFTAVMAIVTFGVCLGLAEWAVREISPQSDLRARDLFHRYEPFVGSEGIPNKRGVFANSSFKTTIVHNAQGFRDRERSFENEMGGLRVLAVGDSFTWGHGVENEEIYTRVLEELVPAVETINLGGPGGDPPSELKVYLKWGLAYEHDVLLMGFFVGNDVVTHVAQPGAAPPRWGFDENGELALIGREVPPEEVERIRRITQEAWDAKWERKRAKRLGNFVKNHFHLWTFIENGRDYGGEIWKGSVLKARIDGWRGKETRIKAWPFLRYCEAEDPEDIAYGWRLVRATFERIRDTAAEAGAEFMVLLIPDMYQTWPSYYEITMRRYGYDPADYDLEKPTRRLVALCEELGIACIDLLPEMRAAMIAGDRVYHRRDRHWNAAGHRMAAEALARELRPRAERTAAASR